ncbi:arylamine N-acetyltransferase family protein [Spirosoma fluminis]
MNVSAYLERLHYTGVVDTTLETLQKLHYQHLLTIPLENLDIHYGQPIELDRDTLFDKVITRKRGGFCYELNGLFYELLRTIGFQVKRVSGRVYEPGKGYNNEFDHLAIIAHIDGTDWLVDVGFGRRFPLHPLAVTCDVPQSDRTGCYVITKHDDQYLAVRQKDEAGNWIAAYIFSLTPRAIHEFEAMCHYHQTSEHSYFTQNMLCTLVTPQGRITLTDNRMMITENGRIIRKDVINRHAFEYLLETYFLIQFDSEACRLQGIAPKR